MANAITSLRLCSALDWRQYVESVSLVEHALQRDPAGAYARMDFLSRDRQRQAVEELAAPSGEAQVRVALKALENARQAAAKLSPADRTAHVGFHLIAEGRRDLEIDVAYRPRIAKRVRRLVFAHATLLYLGPIGVMTAALLAAAAAYARHAGTAWPAVSVFLLLLIVPAADVAISLAQRIVAWAIPPHRLPRLDFSKQLPDNARTMVVVPTLLTSTASVAALLEHIEVLALGNLDPRIHFAILSDLVDANARDLAGDPPILAAARDGIERLNRQFGTGHADRFLPVSSRALLECPGTGVDGMGAQARQDRGIQQAAAGRVRHELHASRSANWRCCPRSATASRWTPTLACRATRRKSSSASSRIR